MNDTSFVAPPAQPVVAPKPPPLVVVPKPEEKPPLVRPPQAPPVRGRSWLAGF